MTEFEKKYDESAEFVAEFIVLGLFGEDADGKTLYDAEDLIREDAEKCQDMVDEFGATEPDPFTVIADTCRALQYGGRITGDASDNLFA